MLRMEGNAIAYATQYSARSAQGTMLFKEIASPDPQWVVESGAYNDIKFLSKGYGKVSQSFGELTTQCWGSTTGDQPARQVGPGQCCQATVVYDDARQAIMETGEVNPLEEISTASRWWSTSRDYPAFHEGSMKTGEVINPRCSENRGSASQHF